MADLAQAEDRVCKARPLLAVVVEGQLPGRVARRAVLLQVQGADGTSALLCLLPPLAPADNDPLSQACPAEVQLPALRLCCHHSYASASFRV